MKNLTAIQFRLGYTISEPLSPENINFYTWLAQIVRGESCTIIEKSPTGCIPISNRIIGDSIQSAIIYDRFWSIFESAKADSNVFLIDINSSPGVFRGHLAFHLAQAINAAITELKNERRDVSKYLFILILPDLLPIADSSYACLAEHIKQGNLVIFSHEGEYDPIERSLPGYSQEQFRLKIISARGNPYEMLEKKMICQLGHFSRVDKDGKKMCTRHSYDGRFCEKEIVTLLEDMIRGSYKNHSQICVFYHCPMSFWLINPILALKNKLGFATVDLSKSKPKNLSQQGTQPAVLVLDFIDTGQTLCRLMDLLIGTGKAKYELKIIAVLATNPTRPKERIRTLIYQDKQYEIRYFMQAEQQRYVEGACPMCNLKLPEISPYSEPYYMLTTFDHWEISIQAGLKNEDDIPNYRSPLPVVINYPKMISLYGAWFAKKARDILSIQPSKFPADAVIVCPEGEKGSQVFTDYLKMLLEVTIIRVPRDVINSFRSLNNKNAEKIAHIKKENPEWFQNLVSMAQYDIIVMDEFNASGQTLEGIKNLLYQLGKRILCYFLLNDLNPKWSELQPHPVYSLYQWQSHKGINY